MEYELAEGKKRRQRVLAVKSTQVFLVAALILMALVITVLCIGVLVSYEVKTDVWNVDSVPYWQDKVDAEQDLWFNEAITELKTALKVQRELEKARNVIIFEVAGIEEAALAAVRFENNKKMNVKKLMWENFSHVGNLLTNCSRELPCDAHSLGTALYAGVRTTKGLGGLDATVMAQDCSLALNETLRVKSILRMAQESGRRTGIVTTKRVTGPTMAALYSFISDTRWECDADMPDKKLLQGCKDIATQLIDDDIGTKLNVIMGGGRQTLLSNTPMTIMDPIDGTACKSKDGRNYLREWRTMKMSKQEKFALLKNSLELNKLNGTATDYVLGIFANGNLTPSWLWNSSESHMPQLSAMVNKALTVLQRKETKFLFVVETGATSGDGLSEQIQHLKHLNETLQSTLEAVGDDTLILVMFSNEVYVDQSSVNRSSSISEDNLFSYPKGRRIFANGPSSYLFQGLHDDIYLAHAVSYALEMGHFRRTK